MNTKPTQSEINKFNRLHHLVLEYEKLRNKDDDFIKIQTEFPSVEREFLDCYWRSMNIDEFCWQFCFDEVNEIDDNFTCDLVEFTIGLRNSERFDEFEYTVNKYGKPFELKYGLPDGLFRDLISDDSINDYLDFMEKIKGNGPIAL